MHIGFGAGSTNSFPIPRLSVWKKKKNADVWAQLRKWKMWETRSVICHMFTSKMSALLVGREQCDSMGFFCGVIRRQLEQQHEAMKRALLCGTSLHCSFAGCHDTGQPSVTEQNWGWRKSRHLGMFSPRRVYLFSQVWVKHTSKKKKNFMHKKAQRASLTAV